jgi:hypothetical protein
MALLCTGLYADWVTAREVAAESEGETHADASAAQHA